MTPKVTAIGATAHAALVQAAGVARVLARLPRTIYMAAGDVIVWLAPATAPLHPRAILVSEVTGPSAGDVTVHVGSDIPWQPAPVTLDAATAARTRNAWRRLVDEVPALGAPAGFGARLLGAPLAFPLEQAGTAADRLAQACTTDDPHQAVEAATALLGVGAGLTPSGDDFVGGALFARRLLADGASIDAAAWDSAAETILAEARSRTHPISVALLGDLARGLAHAPLHDLVAALAADDHAGAVDSARRLVGLGHSSGWDMVAGAGAGLGA